MVIDQRVLEDHGYALGAVFGGPEKRTYFTPDGRTIKAIPALRTFQRQNREGKVVEEGTRDANLDRGWLTSMPVTLKPYCPGCDNWHDTEPEVQACTKSHQDQLKKWDEKYRPRRTSPQDGDANLEDRIKKIEALLMELLATKGGNNGPIL